MTKMLRRGVAFVSVLAAAMTTLPVSASNGADAPAANPLTMRGCTDSSLLLPIEPSRATALVPSAYTVSVTAGRAFLYVSAMQCETIATGNNSPVPGALQLVSIGVAAPENSTSLQPPIGPGRRDSYLLAALTDHRGLLHWGRHHGVPVLAGSPTFALELRNALRHVHTAVTDGLAPITLTGEVTEAGSPVHQHELHYWHEDRQHRAHIALHVEMVDRPGAGRWESPPGSLVASLADRTSGTTPLFLNSNEVSGALSSRHVRHDQRRRTVSPLRRASAQRTTHLR